MKSDERMLGLFKPTATHSHNSFKVRMRKKRVRLDNQSAK
jgi:hypothetical protein